MRQSVEIPRVDAARHQVVTSAFRGALGQHRGFDFQEAIFCQVVTGRLGNLVTHDDVVLDCFSAQVKITIFETQVFGNLGELVKHEGRGFGNAENAQFVDLDFNFPRLHFRIDGSFRTRRYGADGSNDEFIADGFRLAVCFRVAVRVEGQLADAGAVAQIDENQAAVITTPVDPAHQADLLADVLFTQITTIMGSFPVTEYIAQGNNSL